MVLVKYISSYAKTQNKSDIVLVAIFFLLLFLPMSHIEKGEMHISLKENRMLSPYKPLIQNGKINENFGKDFDNWFSDRFLGREKVIKRYNDLQYALMMRKGNKYAFIGQDGWLYTKRFNSVEMYRNANLFSKEELKKIGENLEIFNQKAHQQGIKQVYFVLSHDKESLYPEFYPDGVFKANKQSRLEQLKAYISKEYPTIKMLDFYNQLAKVKQTEVLFCKTGTHMNDMGAYYEYLFLTTAISKDFPSVVPLSLENFNIREDYVCDKDILKSLHLKKYNKENLKNKVLALKNSTLEKMVFEKERQQKDYGKIRMLKNTKRDLPTAVLLGDSFSQRYYKYLAENFSDLYYVYTGSARNFVWFTEEKVHIKENIPDILIIETTERFLHRFLTLEYPEE